MRIIKKIKLLLLLGMVSVLLSNCAILFAEAGIICPSQSEKVTYSGETIGEPDSVLKNVVQESPQRDHTDSHEAKPFLSYSVGGGALWPVSEKFQVSTGLLLTEKGVKFEDSSFNMEEKTNLTYIDLPAKVHYLFGESGFNINAGLQPSLLVGAKTEITINGISSETKGTEGYNTLDVAIGAGAGYRFNNGLAVNLGYDHGLSNVLDNDNFAGFERRNRALKLSVQYFFD